MQMSIGQPATGSRYPDDIEVSADLKPWVPATIRIAWVSTSRLMLECMTDAVARAEPSFKVTPFKSASNCATFSAQPLDLIIYHSRGHDVTSLQELSELRKTLADVKLLVLSDSVTMEPASVERLLADGTSGFILASSNSLDMLLWAIRLVCSGGTFVSREFFLAGRPSKRAPEGPDAQGVPKFTQRERSVLELIKHGKSNKIVAHELGLSVCTVKVHTRNLIRKMGAANRIEAAISADKFL